MVKKKSKQAKKQLDLVFILHYLEMMIWRMERVDLIDKGLIAPLYIAPSWKLARNKKKELG